ncbi:HAD-IA family hydrolase [Pacificoceanicola onchidii]|uniref:HAD-IA family hydrolase n=1 Tax=Pacificoceanicola onchidii TaxID=2562685 RepID=UPI0010A47F63|nr:HAD-IA family hydrolase [Pacificoceanicola onchidii]
MTDLKLVIFDVDGTLVDSQADILASMEAAFSAEGLETPGRDAVLGIVGLSLDQAMAKLAPEQDAETLGRLVEAYKDRYAALRMSGGAQSSPLYPGLLDLLRSLNARDDILLGVATGKSRRGLNALIDSLDLRGFFVTTQVADDHPSKPNPSMVLQALTEAGVEATNAVMIGDTSFDMDMARAAGVRGIAVGWGYHPDEALAGADVLVHDAAALERAILTLLGE